MDQKPLFKRNVKVEHDAARLREGKHSFNQKRYRGDIYNPTEEFRSGWDRIWGKKEN